MLATFIGAPSSGKTTVAALVFANLKERGISVEFVSEWARSYIAGQRVSKGLSPGQGLSLSDTDQVLILQMQMVAEETFIAACGPSVTVLSDTSPLNALLYLSDKAAEDAKVKKWIAKYLSLNPVFFYLPLSNPPAVTVGLDPNRIHGALESVAIDQKAKALISRMGLKVIELVGTSREKSEKALDRILQP